MAYAAVPTWIRSAAIEHLAGVDQHSMINDCSCSRPIVGRSNDAQITGQISREDLNATHHQLPHAADETIHSCFAIDLIAIGAEGESIRGGEIIACEGELRFVVHGDVETILSEQETDFVPLSVVKII